MTYAEKLQNPRWQKKRLEVLNRDSWQCQLCLDINTTLHVHHKKYNKNPWDVDSKDLITYCKHCHAVIELYKFKEGIVPIRTVKMPLENGSWQLHFVYEVDKVDRWFDVYWFTQDSKLEYRCSTNDCSLYWISEVVFNKSKAP